MKDGLSSGGFGRRTKVAASHFHAVLSASRVLNMRISVFLVLLILCEVALALDELPPQTTPA